MSKPKMLLIVLPYVVRNIDVTRSKVRSFLAFPYGLLSLATYNKEYADIKIEDMNVWDENNVEEKLWLLIEEFKPDIIGFTMMFDISYKYLEYITGIVKDHDPNIMVLLGGAAASYGYKEILEDIDDIDAICYSEGETPVRDLLEWFDDAYTILRDHQSWITKENVEDCREPQISFINNLDDVIDIDYSFIDPSSYDMQQAFSPFVDYSKPHKQFFIVTSRGCPYSCAFCSNGKIHGKKMRFASVDRIIKHVAHLVYDLGMDVLTIYDDQLLIDKPRAKELLRRLAPFKIRVECPNGLSPAFIDEEMAYLMRQAGIDTVYLAIEHGSERVLEDIIHKPLKLWMVRPVVKKLREQGIFIHGFFVIGMPGETAEDRLETQRFIKDVELDWAGLNPATPVRGSELYDMCIEKGWITKQSINDVEDKKYIINAPEIGLTPEIIMKDINDMNWDVNFHNNYRMKIGDYKTAAACFEEVIRRYSGHEWAKYYLDICKKKMEGG